MDISKFDDYWTRVGEDPQLTQLRSKVSMHELRLLFQHARDSIAESPKPTGEIVKLFADVVPYSSIVGGGLVLKQVDGRAGFIINFMGTTEGVTKEETAALTEQFLWFVRTFGCAVPVRASAKQEI